MYLFILTRILRAVQLQPCEKCALMGRTAAGREAIISWQMIYLHLQIQRMSGLMQQLFRLIFLPRWAAPEEASGWASRTLAPCLPLPNLQEAGGEMEQCDSVAGQRCCLGAIQMVAMDFSHLVPAVTFSSRSLHFPVHMQGWRAEPELHEEETAWTTCSAQVYCLVRKAVTALHWCMSPMIRNLLNYDMHLGIYMYILSHCSRIY